MVGKGPLRAVALETIAQPEGPFSEKPKGAELHLLSSAPFTPR